MKKDNKKAYKGLYDKIKFTIIFRLLAFPTIILAYVLINFRYINHYKFFVYFLIAFIIFLSITYSLALLYFKKKENLSYLIYLGFIQLFIDFILISVVVLFNGGLDGKFIFLYYLLVLISGFIFLRKGVMIFGVASAVAIGISADMQYYFNIGRHAYFLSSPDKLLFLTSLNILGVLIFSWLLYHFSGELDILSGRIVERDEFIRKSQNFNRELFNSFSQGIIVLGECGKIIFMNKAAIQMLEPDSENRAFRDKAGILYNFNMKITDIFENFPLGATHEMHKNRTTTETKNDRGENALKRFELKYKDMILGFSETKLENKEYKTGKFIFLFRDITYIKQLEMESKINEGLATAGKLAGWLAHEIRNPLAALNTSAYVLNTENISFGGSDYKKLTGIIKIEAQRLDNLVNDFLGFVKVKSKNVSGSANFENFNLFLLAEDLIRGFMDSIANCCSEKAEIKIHNSINKKINVFSEKSRVRHVLLNVMQNAVQSTKKTILAGKKEFRTGIIRLGSKVVEKTGNKRYVSISVSDNGEGMDDFTLKNAFKPLFTTKKDGFGLGLSLVYSITESLNGEIEAISRVNRGTLIRISIPC